MKQLLVLASFFAIVFFLTGCQKDMPVSPVDEITLEKPIKPTAITGELIKDPTNNYLNLQLDWSAIRNATLYNVMVGTKDAVVIYPPVHSATISNVASVVSGTEVTVKIIAYKERKENNVQIAEGTQIFVYNPVIPEIPVINFVSMNVTPYLGNYLNINVNWDDVPGEVSYDCTLIRSLSGRTDDFPLTESEFSLANVSTIYANCNFTFTVRAKNSAGEVITSGSRTYEYTYTPSVPDIPLGGDLTANEGQLDLTVQWDPVPSATIYHCTFFSSKSGATFPYDQNNPNVTIPNITSSTDAVSYIVSVEARNSANEVIALGTKTYNYTP